MSNNPLILPVHLFVARIAIPLVGILSIMDGLLVIGRGSVRELPLPDTFLSVDFLEMLLPFFWRRRLRKDASFKFSGADAVFLGFLKLGLGLLFLFIFWFLLGL